MFFTFQIHTGTAKIHHVIKLECLYVLGGQTGVGDVCPAGKYCPLGTVTPLECAAGTYANETGLSQCHQCPAGYYCLLGNYTTYYCIRLYTFTCDIYATM